MREATEQREKVSGGARRGTLSRRRVLGAAVATALATCGSAMAVLRTSGYVVPLGRTLIGLSPWQFVVVEHAARRITATDREGDSSIPTSDDLDVASFVDGWLSHMPSRTVRDLGRFLAYLEHIAPISVGRLSRFTTLEPRAQDRVLGSVEDSSSDLLRAGFDGLRSLVFLGYYRSPRTWNIIGYDGPLVGRPASGWR
jgi:hypothetical protein